MIEQLSMFADPLDDAFKAWDVALVLLGSLIVVMITGIWTA